MESVNVRLTGRSRYRTTWTGKVVLQVEESGQLYDPRGGGSYSSDQFRWRDARLQDLSIIPYDRKIP